MLRRGVRAGLAGILQTTDSLRPGQVSRPSTARISRIPCSEARESGDGETLGLVLKTRIWIGLRRASLGLCLLSASALADGRFYPPAAYPARVSIPDQRALIQFSNGVERLVIDTRFTTTATNLAWVVPLPATPTIEPATTGLFPTLEFLFRPEIVFRSKRAYCLPLLLGGLGFLALTARKTGRLTTSDTLTCLAMAAVAGHAGGSPVGGMVLLGPFFLWMVHSVRTGRPAMLLVIVVLMVLTLGVVLPAFGTASMKADGTESIAGVDILDRRLVGAYDTTTLTANDPQALQSWLMANGFATPTNTQPVIEAYLKQGWVFVAAKVHRDPAVATNALHPLRFTFPHRARFIRCA